MLRLASWHLVPRPVLLPARARCPKLARTRHVPARVRRSTLRVAADVRPGTAAEAELRCLMMRLREDDVEYIDLKTLCKERRLGGRDSKENLRAKLLRSVRQDLGLPVYSPDNVAPADVRLPQAMSKEELRTLFEARGCMLPASQAQALSMANALLIADGLLEVDQAGPWSTMTVAQLRQACKSRGLFAKGAHEELVKRLEEWDEAMAVEAVSTSLNSTGEAAEPVSVPAAANNAQLQLAQELWAAMHHLNVGRLREEVQRRGLKAQGTKQVLLAKLSEALERDVTLALGGEQRLVQWAASAVGRMGEAEVVAQLAARGVRAEQYPSAEAAATALQAVMQQDWVTEALHGGQAQAQSQAQQAQEAAGAAGSEGWDATAAAAAGVADRGGNGAGGGELYAAAAPHGGAEEAAGREWVWGRPGDPTLSVTLLVGGHTHLQRDAALAAARLATQLLQSDRSHGLLPRQQLELGAGGDREGIAVQAYYAAAGSLFPLTWEQLHTVSAAELDTRLALQSSAATSAVDLVVAADVVLPLGLPPAAPVLLANAGGKVVGTMADEAVAALAADRLAFTSAAAQLGFSTVTVLRLQLADFGDAHGAETLADMAVCKRLEAFTAEQLPHDVSPRLAIRVEVAGSVLGGCLATGPRDALLSSLALMQEHCAGEVVVEAVRPGAHHFTCSVLAGKGGAVALLPTELSYWDVEDDIVESELKLGRWLAVQQGLDTEGVEALLELLRHEQCLHPGYLGGRGTLSQQVRQSTPPGSLSVEAVQAVRLASVKLFQELGLRDYAQFSGWVLPPQQTQQEQEQQAVQQEAVALEELLRQEQEERRRGKSFAELQAIDAAARVKATTYAASSSSGFLAEDLAPTAGEAADTEEPADYGQFNGIVIDGSVRPTAEQILEQGGQFGRPIPTEPSPPVVKALEDLSTCSPQQLCQAGGGQVVAFAQLELAPDLGSPASVLCQQAAMVGLSFEGLLRHLVSTAAVRGGSEPLPPLPEVVAAAEAAAAATADEGEAGDGSGWSLLARMTPFDAPAVKELLEPDFEFIAWQVLAREAAGKGEDAAAADAAAAAATAGGGFEFVDATADPLLDPLVRLQDEGDAELAGEAVAGAAPFDSPIGYDEIREGSPYLDPGADWGAAQQQGQQQDGGGGGVLGLMHPTKQRVWVLLGGDGTQRTQSLQAGLHTYLSLRNDTELEAEAFLLEPSLAGNSEVERRRRLLDRRLDLVQLGMEDEEILQDYDVLDLSRIRHPPPGEMVLENMGVWRLSGSGLVRGEVEDLQCACQVTLTTSNTSLPVLEENGGDIVGVQLSVVRQELELAGVTLDGSAWGGSSVTGQLQPRPAEYMWVSNFVERALEQGACVFLALAGQPAAHGPLQRILEEAGVPYTGSGHLAAETCADKAMLMEQLLDLSTSGISTAPQQKISLPELSMQCKDEGAAERLFEQLRTGLGAGPVPLCIKPAYACNGLGSMRATSGRDFMVYAQAVEAWVSVIPGEVLGGGADCVMPVPPPSQFVVEPYILTEPVRVLWGVDGGIVPPESQAYPDAAPEDALSRALYWPAASSNEWLAVSAVLLGGAGRMHCLGPSVRVLQLQDTPPPPAVGSVAGTLERVQQLAAADQAAEAEDDEEAEALRAAAAEAAKAVAADANQPRHLFTGGFLLTPPPPTLATEQAVASARTRFEMVADRLGLSGAAEVCGYMQVETGEVVVSDVSTTPDLSPGALIFRQAAAADSPLSPAEVLQELVRVGLTQPLDEHDDMQVLGYPELSEEAAGYNYPSDAGFAAYPPASYSEVAEGGAEQFDEQYSGTRQW